MDLFNGNTFFDFEKVEKFRLEKFVINRRKCSLSALLNDRITDFHPTLNPVYLPKTLNRKTCWLAPVQSFHRNNSRSIGKTEWFGRRIRSGFGFAQYRTRIPSGRKGAWRISGRWLASFDWTDSWSWQSDGILRWTSMGRCRWYIPGWVSMVRQYCLSRHQLHW